MYIVNYLNLNNFNNIWLYNFDNYIDRLHFSNIFSNDNIKQYIQLSLNSNEKIVIATTYSIHD